MVGMVFAPSGTKTIRNTTLHGAWTVIDVIGDFGEVRSVSSSGEDVEEGKELVEHRVALG